MRSPQISALVFLLLAGGCIDSHLRSVQGALRVEPTELDFGTVKRGSKATSSLLLENVGSGPLTITGLEIADATEPIFSVTVTAPITLASGESLAAPVELSTESAKEGAHSATLVLRFDDPTIAPVQVPLRAKVTPDGGVVVPGLWIAFDSNRINGNRDLFVMRPDGKELRRLTTEDWNEVEPAFSPDGKSLAFASDRSDFTMQIYVMDLATKAIRQVTHGSQPARTPAWSPDGKRLAFFRYIGIYTISVDGTDEQHIVDGLDELNPYRDPHYLPNGGWLLMSRGNSIELIRTDGTDRRQVVEYAATRIWMPSPSPSGASVAFAAYCIDGFSIRNASTGSITSPCIGDSEMHFPGTHPAWGPDQLAFETDEANRDILVMTPPNGPAINLTANPADDRNAAWSPPMTAIP